VRRAPVAFFIAVGCLALVLTMAALFGSSSILVVGTVGSGALVLGYLFGAPRRPDAEESAAATPSPDALETPPAVCIDDEDAEISVDPDTPIALELDVAPAESDEQSPEIEPECRVEIDVAEEPPVPESPAEEPPVSEFPADESAVFAVPIEVAPDDAIAEPSEPPLGPEPEIPAAATSFALIPQPSQSFPLPADTVPAAGEAPQAVAPVRLRVRAPIDVECPSVLAAWLEAASQLAPAIAAHMWLEDPATATMRLIHAVGPMVPDPTPVPIDESLLGEVARAGTAKLEALARLTDVTGEFTLWRFAVPLKAGTTVGVGAVDFRSLEMPDAAALNEIAGTLRGALSGCLALHISRSESASAELLLELARDLSRRLDREEVMSLALTRAMELSGAATGSVMLLDEAGERMRIVESRGLPSDVVEQTTVAESEGIAGWVLASRRPLLIEDLPGRAIGNRRHGVRSAVSVPIGDEDGMLGVLNVGSRRFPARFTSSHLKALEIIGRQLAVALRNATAIEAVRDVYFDTLRTLAAAMETRDPYSAGHSARIAELALEVGRRMGLHESDLQALEIAALLHDIGMNAAGESVAMAARPLSAVERGLLKMHPVLAAEIIEQAPALRAAVPIVYHHHEWFDGTGYVGGVAGEAIPLGARILAVADAFVAMTSDRPYRKAMSDAEAVHELREKSGSQFDAGVVDIFLGAL